MMSPDSRPSRGGRTPRAVTPSAMALVPMFVIDPVNPQFRTYCCNPASEEMG
jgi:hypothetical protein